MQAKERAITDRPENVDVIRPRENENANESVHRISITCLAILTEKKRNLLSIRSYHQQPFLWEQMEALRGSPSRAEKDHDANRRGKWRSEEGGTYLLEKRKGDRDPEVSRAAQPMAFRGCTSFPSPAMSPIFFAHTHSLSLSLSLSLKSNKALQAPSETSPAPSYLNRRSVAVAAPVV